MRISDVLLLIGVRDPNCPNEADVLAYSENRLSTRSRAQVERHFADCDDCRQVLAFLVRESDEAPAPVTEAAVSAQTNSVLAYIQNDERKRIRSERRDPVPTGFHISLPKLASAGLVVSALAIAFVLMFIPGQSSADAAMEALRLADMRYTEARVSGGFDHSDYARPTRGVERNAGESNNNDALHLDRAENKVTAAAQEPAAVEAKLVLARVWLARGDREHAKRALDILNQLLKSGIGTPEVLNDTGVAHFQLETYPEAIAYFSLALEKSPAYNEALFNRALAEQRDHRDAEARQDWQQFINQSSDENWKSEARERLSGISGPTDR